MSLTQKDFERLLNVSRETSDRFALWGERLEMWNRRINLVGPGAVEDFWGRHALDGAQLIRHVTQEPATWVDLGTGGGSPGLAIALMTDALGWSTKVTLVESNQKKAAFLREAIRETGAPAEVFADRAERLTGERFDVVSARAFAPADRLFGYAHPLWKSGSAGLFLKGRGADDELTEAAKHWTFTVNTLETIAPGDGVIWRVEDLTQ